MGLGRGRRSEPLASGEAGDGPFAERGNLMDDVRADSTERSVEQAGSTRRSVLLGAGAIAGAAAMVSSLGAPHVSAAPGADQILCTMPAPIGTFVLNSLQWGAVLGVGSVGAGGTRTTSAPSISEVTVTKVLDGSSTGLFGALLGAEEIQTTTITFSFKAGTPSITLVLDDVIVSGYSLSSGGQVPSESLSFNFTKFTLTVNGVPLSYDLTTGKV